ncbi:3-oxoadipate enol-lactonase [Corynebacterium pygosceleis]|uniref:3-oxoadipate enol-lactonase n=1 Tax=Corynebacterium pygosceleis TaxID=2800406 RepID=UPI0020037FDA|nr:3-oxoadipate enol-lactonase [Corynebacterium pygosceleis]MCK7675768.1 3-oxoadipate enol-lactonase [Corynebacterium pygosceleis]
MSENNHTGGSPAVRLDVKLTGETADAIPVVLIGSLGSDRSMWEEQTGPLSEKWPLVAVDLRGHGASPVPDGPYSMPELAADVLNTLDDLRVRRAHIVGLSLGGAIAQQIALDAPERVTSLTLLSTAAKFGEEKTWRDKASTVRSEGTEALAHTVAHNWFTPTFGEAGAFADYEAMVSACPDEGYAACCEALAEFDSRSRLGEISCPTLVVSAADDPSTPPDVVRVLADGIPGARLESISPAAHLVNVEQAAAVNQLLADHFTAAV